MRALVMCDTSKNIDFAIILLIFDTALADFEKVIFCDNYRNIKEYFDKSTAFSV